MAVLLFPESEREWGAAMVAIPSDQADCAGKSEGVAAAWEEITSDSGLASVDTLSRLCAIIDTQNKHVSTTRSSSSYHSFAEPKSHLPWFQVCNHDNQSPNEILGFVGGLDSCEYLPTFFAAKAECQFQQLVRLGDMLGADYAGNP